MTKTKGGGKTVEADNSVGIPDSQLPADYVKFRKQLETDLAAAKVKEAELRERLPKNIVKGADVLVEIVKKEGKGRIGKV